MPTFYAVLFSLAFFLLSASFFVGAFLLWLYSEKRSLRGPRVILCPENRACATISIDATRAARTLLAGHEEFTIATCSRWPEMQHCDQACAVQVPLVADDRRRGYYAPFGLTPNQLRINNPVRMTPAILAKLGRRYFV